METYALSATWPRISAKHQQLFQDSKEVKKDQAYWRAKFNPCLAEIANQLPDDKIIAKAALRIEARSRQKVDGKWPVRNQVKKPDGPWPDQDVVPDSKEHVWRRKFYACMSEMVQDQRYYGLLAPTGWTALKLKRFHQDKFFRQGFWYQLLMKTGPIIARKLLAKIRRETLRDVTISK